MSTPTIAIGALGGTIAMTSTDGDAISPTLDAAALAASVPGLAEIAELRMETLAMLPSASLDEPVVLAALGWARTAVDEGATGVVLTQGTDTLEESAYLLDLFWDRPEPLVVTGAMRSPQAAGADGPANLLTAVQCALTPNSRDRGVLVAFDDEIHLARWVTKADSMATGAFRSPVFGPVARRVEGAIQYAAPSHRPTLVRWEAVSPNPRASLLWTWLGDDGTTLRQVAQTPLDGVVVAGSGAGHVSAALADEIGRVVATTPVVVATRTGAGPTARDTYGYPGSEVDLLRRGAIGAGWLAPVKARLLLWSLLRAGTPRDQLAERFREHGQL